MRSSGKFVESRAFASPYRANAGISGDSEVEFTLVGMAERLATDRNGNNVRVGDLVRIVALEPGAYRQLSEEEMAAVVSMIGETFSVEEIDEYGSAWVWKWWHLGDGKSESHGICLSALEMELVEAKNAN